MDQEEVVGYIHDVSHVGQGQSKKFFDFRLQTQEDVIRGVCFSPGKKRAFEDAALKKSPVKLKKFIHDKKNTTDILMNDKVLLEEVAEVDFEYRQIVPHEMNIGKLNIITPEQMITLKAKVINLSQPTAVHAHGGTLAKVEGLLIDPHGTVKLLLWEADTDVVKEGKTFKNIRLKKNKLTGELYVNPAKGCSVISDAEDFPPASLQPPQATPEELVTSTVTGEVIGIQKCSVSFCCFKCNRAIPPTKSVIITCPQCNLKQKSSKCRKQWYVNAVISTGDKNITLNFYHAMVVKVLEMALPDDINTCDEDVVSDMFFGLSSISCTYNERTRAVETIKSCLCE